MEKEKAFYKFIKLINKMRKLILKEINLQAIVKETEPELIEIREYLANSPK